MTHSSFTRTHGSHSRDMRISVPPFPKRQMLVLAICRICEPIAFMGIFPYVYYMIRDFHITEDESKISFYAGMVTSAFTFAEFLTGLLWGRLSDKVGRKPVLLTGLAGTALSVLIFGFAPNLTVALLARAIGGLLNGYVSVGLLKRRDCSYASRNMGVLQTTVAELVTVKEHQPRAYTIMPVVWGLGSIVGPMIGGALAQPCISYPTIFARGTIWDRYPYLLPNLLSAFIVLIGVINGFLFLEETHAQRKMDRDRGLEIGQWIQSKLPKFKKCTDLRDEKSKLAVIDELLPLVDHDEDLPTYRTNENTPTSSPRLRSASVVTIGQDALSLSHTRQHTGVGISRTFTRPVILNIVSFGILAFHTMTFDQLLPVFLETAVKPSEKIPTSLPFKFVDGFAFDTKTVGIILSIQGVYQLFVNLVLVPTFLRRFGALRLFRFVVVAYFLLYVVTPYLVLLPEAYRFVGIGAVLIWKCTFASMMYPSNAILTADSAPSHLALGTINGVAASTASLCRAFGPTISGILYAVGLKSGYSGLAWWCSALVAIAGAFVGLQIPDPASLHENRGDDRNAQDRDLEFSGNDS
ncbi:major facilitator superfamily domain-containing protein [Xylariaceae sp. FL1272]|nr:major facilitator superfamily domain-containing protein [Xylariaceae sp. FL1272]